MLMPKLPTKVEVADPATSKTPAVVVDLPTPNPPVKYPLPETESCWSGLDVPMPILPFVSMTRAVFVAEAVEVLIRNSGRLSRVAVEVAERESKAPGVEVPRPR